MCDQVIPGEKQLANEPMRKLGPFIHSCRDHLQRAEPRAPGDTDIRCCPIPEQCRRQVYGEGGPTESGKQAQLNVEAMASPSSLLCVLYLQSHATQHCSGYRPHSLWVQELSDFWGSPKEGDKTFLLWLQLCKCSTPLALQFWAAVHVHTLVEGMPPSQEKVILKQ